MAEKREICTCTHCGNEAEMVVTCELVQTDETSGSMTQQERQTRKCTICGNEAEMIVDFAG